MIEAADSEPDYVCPTCGQPSVLIVSKTQAFCTHNDCPVLCWDPMLPDPPDEVHRIRINNLPPL